MCRCKDNIKYKLCIRLDRCACWTDREPFVVYTHGGNRERGRTGIPDDDRSTPGCAKRNGTKIDDCWQPKKSRCGRTARSGAKYCSILSNGKPRQVIGE